jgi:hypothetical protein
MTTRNYSSRSQQTTLTSAVTAGALTMVVQSGTALLGGQSIPAGTTFTIVVDPDTALEEIVDATAVSTNTFTITRGIETGGTGQAHSAGAVVRHMATGRDFREANTHIEASTGVHGISNSSSVVGTIDNQTLTNKTLTSPTITNPTISGTNVDASIVFEGATPDAFETTLTVVDPTQDNTITLPNTTGTVVIATATQTLTNKTLTSPTISGSPVITGLSSAGMSASSATPKDYVDSILGSATAASTSAASAAASATAAATSATSAASSASAAASSATASATSASAAATSASSAATSATAAATSETNASTSASSAATSASSAATSATSSANSATASATSATASATSASAAATSASSAATSASSAATSATSAATSYDEFDDRYLGSKSSAPTLDNDGNALIVGAMYWNNVSNLMFVWSGSVWVQITTTASYSAPTLGSTTINSGATVTNVNGLTINSTTIPTSKTLVATDSTTYVVPSQSGQSGKYLTTDGTTSSWGTVTTYSAPTLGSTSIGSGATVTNVNGLTINSTTIPTSKTLVDTDSSQTLTNKTLTAPTFVGPEETLFVGTSTGLAGTSPIDVLTAGVWYYTPSSTANFTLNFRGNGSTTLNSILPVNGSITVAVLNTNGSTPYYASAYQIDGSAVTPKWSGGTAPAAGNASAIDAYSFTIIKTAATPTYTVLAAGPVKYA